MDIKLTGLSVLFEIGAFFSIFSDFYGSIFAFFILHGIATLILSIVIWTFVPKKYKIPFPMSIIALNVLLFITPVMNYLAFLIFVFILRKQKRLPLDALESIPFFELFDEKFRINRRKFGESSVREFVQKKEIPSDLRLKAFLFLTEIGSPESVRLIKAGLQDPDDEIRLLSFSVIDKVEKRISEEIHKNLNRLKYTKDKKELGKIYSKLAGLYWENVYIGIADPEISDFYLTEAEKYAKLSIDLVGDDPYIDLLLGRIYLQKGELDASAQHLHKALSSGIPQFKVAPYLAELYFRIGRYSKIKEIMKRYRYLKYDPFFYPVAVLWEEE